jgi:hypothetical protein
MSQHGKRRAELDRGADALKSAGGIQDDGCRRKSAKE